MAAPVNITKLAAQLRHLGGLPVAFRTLDVLNQINPPADKKEREVVRQHLPPELRNLFDEACGRADHLRRSRV